MTEIRSTRPTTVGELITFLQTQPADLRVVVDGYGGGYTDPSAEFVEDMIFDYREASYTGPHEDLEYAYLDEDEYDQAYVRPALVLGRS